MKNNMYSKYHDDFDHDAFIAKTNRTNRQIMIMLVLIGCFSLITIVAQTIAIVKKRSQRAETQMTPPLPQLIQESPTSSTTDPAGFWLPPDTPALVVIVREDQIASLFPHQSVLLQLASPHQADRSGFGESNPVEADTNDSNPAQCRCQ